MRSFKIEKLTGCLPGQTILLETSKSVIRVAVQAMASSHRSPRRRPRTTPRSRRPASGPQPAHIDMSPSPAATSAYQSPVPTRYHGDYIVLPPPSLGQQYLELAVAQIPADGGEEEWRLVKIASDRLKAKHRIAPRNQVIDKLGSSIQELRISGGKDAELQIDKCIAAIRYYSTCAPASPGDMALALQKVGSSASTSKLAQP